MTTSEMGKAYSDGELIFAENESGNAMYVIQAGAVDVTRQTPEGEVAIASLGEGEIFGEMALFDKLPRSATVRASGEAKVLSIDKKRLFATISRDPTLVFKLMESLGRRVRKLNDEVMRLRKSEKTISPGGTVVQQTCKRVLAEVKNAVDATHGSIMLLDEKEESLSIEAAFGSESSSKLRLGPGHGIAGDVLTTGQALLVNNASRDKRFIPGRIEIESLLCVPLVYNDRVTGVVNASSGARDAFSSEDVKHMCAVASCASIAIRNAKGLSALESAAGEILKNATAEAV